MKTQRFSLTHVFLAALVVCGCIGVAAMGFNYSGKIDIRLGSDGITFRIDGGEKPEKLKLESKQKVIGVALPLAKRLDDQISSM